jgi:hypothetical protein
LIDIFVLDTIPSFLQRVVFLLHKTHYASGAMLLAFLHVIGVVCSACADTQFRRQLLVNEAVRLGMFCRLFGGDFKTTISGIHAIRARGWLSARRAMEIATALRWWFPVYGRVPAMSWLNWRFPQVNTERGAARDAIA